MVCANFQTLVSGADDSFFWKYGDRAERTNLCKWKDSEAAVRVISEVWGVLRVRSEVICDARGCKGSVLFE